MSITNIKVNNFKSFKRLSTELGPLTVVIGANASGKSNFVQIFRFLMDIVSSGLDNAISLQGGMGYLRNVNMPAADSFSLEVTDDRRWSKPIEPGKAQPRIRTSETTYRFSLHPSDNRLGYEITEDSLIQKYEILGLERDKKGRKIKEPEIFGRAKMVFSRKSGKIKTRFSKSRNMDVDLKSSDILPHYSLQKEFGLRSLKAHQMLLTSDLLLFLPPFSRPPFVHAGIYDFDPKFSKVSTPISGKAELEEDGKNLAIVLRNILQDKEDKEKLQDFLTDLLPFVVELGYEKLPDRSLLFNLEETYSKKEKLPASFLSDGTINVIAIILALYFEKKALTIIEEPERYIHPYLASTLMNLVKDASQDKQIIVTTHSPEIVQHVDLENILLVSRDSNGFSVLSRPATKKDVQVFLDNEIGIQELYVQNLL